MAEKPLVDGSFEASVQLLQELDKGELKPELVAWFYYDDVEDWRLLLCGKKINEYLPGKEALAYKIVAESIGKTNSALAVSDVKFIKTDAPLVVALSFLIGTGPGDVSKISMSNNTINGMFIKDMVVLRSAVQRQ
ncbi:hypothetical protein DBB42_26290 [Pseudomonas plecoglossicida]|uniref:Uncharacterized protein n=1 Tax=Pseudomonas plecoglossicida TaxID=70775 RepID=A0A2R7UAR6_PSEDL|nr:hypothetical protein [Pseudomonas plecoglossicida]PTU49277.1 hypothetical protein DBB42_26290 [Pseudomonas plecoglossicida]